jgi:hypothetical protein
MLNRNVVSTVGKEGDIQGWYSWRYHVFEIMAPAVAKGGSAKVSRKGR